MLKTNDHHAPFTMCLRNTEIYLCYVTDPGHDLLI